MNYNDTFATQIEEIKTHITDNVEQHIDCEMAELHHHLFNEDYYVVGTHDAKQFIGENVFAAIGAIIDYEKENFGETYTDTTCPEKVANMLAYVLGEHVLNQLDTVQDNWDERLTDDMAQDIITELEA